MVVHSEEALFHDISSESKDEKPRDQRSRRNKTTEEKVERKAEIDGGIFFGVLDRNAGRRVFEDSARFGKYEEKF